MYVLIQNNSALILVKNYNIMYLGTLVNEEAIKPLDLIKISADYKIEIQRLQWKRKVGVIVVSH